MIFALLACTSPVPENTPSPTESSPVDSEDSQLDSELGDSEPDDSEPPIEPADWTILVFMNGDNDLEHWITHDLNELELGLFDAEAAGSGKIRVLTQSDRIDGYDDASDGGWTGTRRYEIVADDDPWVTASVMLEDMGEVNMGEVSTLQEFIAWGTALAPAEKTGIVLWNHGTSWTLTGDAPPPPGVSWDDTSDADLSIAEGELQAALAPYVEANGKFDFISFDACNMASWEVAYALMPYGLAMSAAETTVGMNGLQYTPGLAALGANPAMTGADLMDIWAYDAVNLGGENTFAAIDLTQMEAVAAHLDGIALEALDDPEVMDDLLAARDAARGVQMAQEAYLDLGDLAVQLATHEQLGPPALALTDAIEGAVVGAYGSSKFSWVHGLTVYFDPYLLDSYGESAWADVTHWDELLVEVQERL